MGIYLCHWPFDFYTQMSIQRFLSLWSGLGMRYLERGGILPG